MQMTGTCPPLSDGYNKKPRKVAKPKAEPPDAGKNRPVMRSQPKEPPKNPVGMGNRRALAHLKGRR